MFGNTSNAFGTRPSGSSTQSLFGAASSAQPSISLFGTQPAAAAAAQSTAPTSTGLFGAAPTAAADQSAAAPAGGLFASASTNQPAVSLFGTRLSIGGSQTSAATTGSNIFSGATTPTTGQQQQAPATLFGSTETSGLFARPAAAAPQQPRPLGTLGTSLFSAPAAATTAATSSDLSLQQQQPKSNPSLFGAAAQQPAAATETAGGGGGLFKAKSNKLFETAAEAKQASSAAAAGATKSFLFNPPATVDSSSTKPSTGLFGGASGSAAPATNPSLGLGSSLAEAPKSASAGATGLFGASSAPRGGLFGGSLGGAAEATARKDDENNKDDADASKQPQSLSSSFLPAFGSSATETPKIASKKPVAVPSVEAVKATALETSQYLKVDDLMRNWEHRLKRQVYDFGRFSEAVMRLDLDLCKTVNVLENVQQEQTLIEVKQQELDMSLDQIENHQVSLTKMLQQMEMLLTSQLPADSSVHPLQGAVQSLSANLDDSNSLLDELAGDVNKIQASLFPGALGKIVDLVNVQQRSIEKLSDSCHQLKDRISSLEQMP